MPNRLETFLASHFSNPPLGVALLTLTGIEAAFSRDIADVYPTATASGNPITITDGAGGIPIESCTVNFAPVQNLNGYDAPWRGGGRGNLFDKDGADYLSLYLTSGTIHSIGDIRMVCMPCEPSTTYTISAGVTTTLRVGSFTAQPPSVVEATVYNSPSGQTASGNGIAITTGESDAYLAIQIIANADVSAGTTYSEVAASLMVEKGTSVSAWVPYSNICPISGWDSVSINIGSNSTDYETTTVSMPSTIYGGTAEVISGVGSQTWAVVDLGDLTWYYATSGTYPCFRSPSLTDRLYGTSATGVVGYCSAYGWYLNASLTYLYNNLSDKYFGFQSGSHNIVFRDDDYTNAASFKAAVAGVKLAYPLAEPVAFETDPVTLNTLYGTNIISSNANGTITLIYHKTDS